MDENKVVMDTVINKLRRMEEHKVCDYVSKICPCFWIYREKSLNVSGLLVNKHTEFLDPQDKAGTLSYCPLPTVRTGFSPTDPWPRKALPWTLGSVFTWKLFYRAFLVSQAMQVLFLDLEQQNHVDYPVANTWDEVRCLFHDSGYRGSLCESTLWFPQI